MAENPRSKMNPYDAIYVCVSSYAELFLSCEYMRLATVKATLTCPQSLDLSTVNCALIMYPQVLVLAIYTFLAAPLWKQTPQQQLTPRQTGVLGKDGESLWRGGPRPLVTVMT
jgi:hypothetical protein